MKNLLHFFLLMVISLSVLPEISNSQIPDNTDGRLWRLCKVWGFAKYYHPNNCNVNWNNLLIPAIDSVLVSTSNASFNDILLSMLNAAGVIPHATTPLVNNNTLNKNAHFEWADDVQFSQQVRDILDSIEVNFRPVPSCLVKYDDYYDPSYTGFIDFSSDTILNIPLFSYTKESNRLLVFFYYWNIINYFHPDKDLMDQDWDSTLYQFVPLFRQVTNDEDFHLRFLNLVTYLNDSHGFTGSGIITDHFGSYYPYIKIQYIENQTVVTKVGTTITGVSVGDILKKMDGTDIAILRDSLAEFTPASNENSKERDLHDYNLLQGPANTEVLFEFEDSTGATYQVSLPRTLTVGSYLYWSFTDPNPVYEITDCGYGYVDMGKLTSTQIPAMYDLLKNTPAIIFDIRNYPNGTLWPLIPYFYDAPETWSLLTIPDPDFPGWYSWYDNKFDAGSFSNPEPYPGRVIILCNAETQSQAEYTVMGLQQCANSFTIGSQTAGADGNISYIYLPGDLYTYWTSLGIYYPDSTTAQRVGVKIDSVVTPTIDGIRKGIDEVLLAALDCLTGIEKVPGASLISVYPNPAHDLIYFSGDFTVNEMLQIDIFNTLGQRLKTDKIQVENKSPFALDVSGLASGFYIILLRSEQGKIFNAKIQVVNIP